MAQQVYGGHGYIEEWGMSQYVRDARIAMIYEGANGIQALDLVGRKLPANGGRAMQAFFKEVGDFCEENRENEQLTFFTKHLKKGLNDLQAATMWFVQNAMAKPNNAGAGSHDYMHLFGLVALGYMWALQARAANEKIAAGANSDRAQFLESKLTTARYFMERVMPETVRIWRAFLVGRRFDDGASRRGVLIEFGASRRSSPDCDATGRGILSARLHGCLTGGTNGEQSG
jgi:acyl-CoA dehydrogenase